MSGQHVRTTGLTDLVAGLKGPAFKDVNRELRSAAKEIAAGMLPAVRNAVAGSGAPQAAALAATARVHSDRVPVVVVGKVNPRFTSGFHPSATSQKRRGALARGVVGGPAGGRRDTRAAENYYRIRRDPSWGGLGAAIHGPILREAEAAYLRAYLDILHRHGFTTKG